ncbi:conserved hypothetical protein [Histoplasma capsulatum H143]|uniref:Uncharacterized protein n=1 Tax=Ajellomyces capsulatus (strain H143) TaxID=544712 RepID=C6H5I5_AJECH|nr:conserved hypothetical protein [Histoplasma capsulatum H143]
MALVPNHVSQNSQLPCERCIPKLGDVDSWCAFGPKARKRCEACASAGKTCAPLNRTLSDMNMLIIMLVRRIMRGRAFIFYDVAAGEDMANHKERLRRLVKQLDAPRLARLSARGRVGANALWSRCRAAAVPARMQDMEAVVVPGSGGGGAGGRGVIDLEDVEWVKRRPPLQSKPDNTQGEKPTQTRKTKKRCLVSASSRDGGALESGIC